MKMVHNEDFDSLIINEVRFYFLEVLYDNGPSFSNVGRLHHRSHSGPGVYFAETFLLKNTILY